MLINNQIAPEGRDWSYLMFDGLPPGPGVLFEEVTLDERVGAEAWGRKWVPKDRHRLNPWSH